mmetsp:Transcript_11793/g.32289  ORF Transcript_11793/g.32289 Transcript_11793/m.32289 type:complete len:259 (-) Transcript_11793:109-885(-)
MRNATLHDPQLALLHEVHATSRLALSYYALTVLENLRDKGLADPVLELRREGAKEPHRVKELAVLRVVLLDVGLQDVLEARTVNAPDSACPLGGDCGAARAVVHERKGSEGHARCQHVDGLTVDADLEPPLVRHEVVAAGIALLHDLLTVLERKVLHAVHQALDLRVFQQCAEPVLVKRRRDELSGALALPPELPPECQLRWLPFVFVPDLLRARRAAVPRSAVSAPQQGRARPRGRDPAPVVRVCRLRAQRGGHAEH